MARIAVLLSCLGLLATGCASSSSDSDDSSEIHHAMKSIEYSYGVVVTGVFRRIYISPDGFLRVVDKGVTQTGYISDAQEQELTAMFDGWDRLGEDFPGVPDAPVCSITYAGKTVRVGQGAKDIPDQFMRVRSRLEYLSRTLPLRSW